MSQPHAAAHPEAGTGQRVCSLCPFPKLPEHLGEVLADHPSQGPRKLDFSPLPLG